MINIPAEILSIEELEKASGMKEKDISISFSRIDIQKMSLITNVDIKLNFVMPLQYEKLMCDRLLNKFKSVRRIKPTYIYEGISETQVKKKAVLRTDADLVLGKNFDAKPISFSEAHELAGSRNSVVLEGELIQLDSRPITSKKNTVLMLGIIANHNKAFAIKKFMNEKEYADLTKALSVGDYISLCGRIENDSYARETVMMVNAIKHAERELKMDTYPDGRRVELHIHTKMSDNDGFNEIADVVKTAARWGQKAVAITDHGVVQAFPDAAMAAKALKEKGQDIKVIYGLEGYLYPDEDACDENGNIDIKKNGTYHIILLAKNTTGLMNLYKLVSYSHIDYFYRKPRLPRSVIDAHREGLIIGSACEAGEVYKAVERGASDEELDRIASYYDYLEIQPLGNNEFMIRDGIVSGKQDLIDNNLRIVACGDRLGKLVCATTDSHYPSPDAAIYRNIIMKGIGFTDTESDCLYMRTTDEMMEEFSYLGDRAKEIVIDNTNKIADMTEEFMPVPKGKYPPKIDGAEERLRKSCYDKAHELYGDPLPAVIEERLKAELGPIIKEGYAVMYVAAQMLVQKSNQDGYLVGSRGSVGSSFAATMAGITEVNPLPPHYRCPKCKYLEFEKQIDKYDCGFDLPDKNCPKCGTALVKDGLNIPFATFLGFDGNKEPDIDLNFAGEYQPTAHKYVGEIFGEKNVFKAGTVSTIQEKTAYGYVKHYFEEANINISKSDMDLYAKGCTGVKRTTGQHPGGIIIVPDDHEIFEFCPIQKPANKREVDVITTHFDYHKIDNNLLKLDILGHDVPQMVRHLQDMTGVDPMTINLGDKKTLSIFTSLDALEIKNPDYKFTHGTYAIPEFGTNFTRQMLDDIKPTTVSALIKMSGFSHGTAVWTGNAQDLIRNKVATIDEVISSRDDIMNYLILKGVPNRDAFKIMETVRKNRQLSDEQLNMMKEHDVPAWYIKSCETLEYLFPRAHASAYVMMSIRMAWYKVYYPAEFYAAYFTSKIDAFNAECISEDAEAVLKRWSMINSSSDKPTAKQESNAIVYEVIYEMLSRGYEFCEPILGESDPCKFLVKDGKVLPPYMAVDGVGRTAAESIQTAYMEKPFVTIDDVRRRTKLSQTNIDELRKHGLFSDLPESAQISIFDL